MKNKKRKNKFDSLVERLIEEFVKIPNFDLTSIDEVANKTFNIIAFRIAEISSYRDLVCSHFIPATNKAIFDSQKDFQNSQYKFLLKTKQLDFKETLYETVRLAYVGLFHKLENYANDVVKIPDLIFGELYETEDTTAKWAKGRFKFDVKDWKQFYITDKVNWICNCVKHKDGFPVKEPKPFGYTNADESQRIRITPEEFKQDCDTLIKLYPIYIQAMFIFAQHKLIMEKPLLREDYKYSPELYEKQIENRNRIEQIVQNFVRLFSEMKT